MIEYIKRSLVLITLTLIILNCKAVENNTSSYSSSENIHLSFDDKTNEQTISHKKLTSTDGVNKLGAYLDGNNYIKVKDLPIVYPYTISTWFRGKGVLLSNIFQCSQNSAWSLKVFKNSIHFYYKETSFNSRKTHEFPIQSNVGEWNLINIIFKSNKEVLFVINNQVVSTLQLETSLENFNSTLLIGTDNCAIVENNFKGSFIGDIDELKIYIDQALSINDIQYNYINEPTSIRKVKLSPSTKLKFDFSDEDQKNIFWDIKQIKNEAIAFTISSNKIILDNIPINPFTTYYSLSDLEEGNTKYNLSVINQRGNIIDTYTLVKEQKKVLKTNKLIYRSVEGYGTSGTYGEGGTIYRVTNLNDSGKGSLRYGLENISKKRVIVFEVAGKIRLKSDIKITNPYISIFGQTAPDPGIHIFDAGIHIITHDVLLQHLSIRPSDSDYSNTIYSVRDAISILGKEKSKSKHTYNVIIDHCSLGWSTDEIISTWYEGVQDITISNCIIAEALNDSKHPNGKHSKGMLIGPGSKNIAIIKNIFYNNADRNPLISGNSDVLVSNNLISNTESKIKLNDEHKKGEITSIVHNNIILIDKNPLINIIELKPEENHNIELQGEKKTSGKVMNRKKINNKDFYRFKLNNTFKTSKNLLNHLLANTGANPDNRSETDHRIINEIKSENIYNYVDCIYCNNKESIQQREINSIKEKKRKLDVKFDSNKSVHNQIVEKYK